jgi:hypothetical protein
LSAASLAISGKGGEKEDGEKEIFVREKERGCQGLSLWQGMLFSFLLVFFSFCKRGVVFFSFLLLLQKKGAKKRSPKSMYGRFRSALM